MQKPDYSYFAKRSEREFKYQLKYIDKNQIVQVRVDRRCVTKMVEMILNSLPLEDGVLSLRCKLRGTKCEAHITLMSRQDTVIVIDMLGKDCSTEIMDSVKTTKFYLERINLYERKGLGGTPKNYLLRIDGRLKEGLREKLGLQI